MDEWACFSALLIWTAFAFGLSLGGRSCVRCERGNKND